MSSLAQLEDQINALNALNRSSAKALDTFADTSNAISVRARQITRDVKPWEVAQENIALTIEEMSKAARCYHPPPTLYAVLAKREKNPETVARCIDYLVYTDDYLSSHPPNDFGDEVHTKAESQLRQIVLISEEMVKTSFLRALERPISAGVTLGSSSASAAPPSTGTMRGGGRGQTKTLSVLTGKGLVIKNPAALEGVGLVIQRLGENFNRTEVVQNDVFSLLRDRLQSLVESQFDSAYREDEVGKAQLSTHANMTPVMKHYQRGQHRLLGISRTARRAVGEVGDCVQEHIIEPLEEDYAVAEMPSMLATVIFDIIMARALSVIHFDKSVFANPTKMFVDSRGQGIGLCPGVRYFRDVVFVGLDLIEELWAWKALAGSLPGEHDNFIDHVDNKIEHFVFEVRDLLDGYVTCKGALDKALLKEYTVSQRRTEWFPSVDCTAHELATNVLYFHKVLLTSYYGAIKIALFGNTLTANAEEEAVQEVEDYLIRCVLGTLQELRVVAEAAVELQEEADEKGHRRVGPRSGAAHLLGGAEGARLSPPIFLLNNVIFLEENYRREPCFTQRTMRVDADETMATALPHTANARQSTGDRGKGRKGKPDSGPTAVPIVTHILAMLADEKEQCIDDFARSWEACFPTNESNPDLASINPDGSQPLRKSQRMAVKKWHKTVAERLQEKIRDCRVEAVMSTAIRARLIDLSLAAVQEHWGAFDDVLRGREWSSRPQKWMPLTRDDLFDQIRKIF